GPARRNPKRSSKRQGKTASQRERCIARRKSCRSDRARRWAKHAVNGLGSYPRRRRLPPEPPSERDGNVGLYQGFYIFTFKAMCQNVTHANLTHAGVGGNVGAAQRGGGRMSRAPRIPDRGDIPPNAVASVMGLSLAEFHQLLPELNRRGFPPPDATTGRYCVE